MYTRVPQCFWSAVNAWFQRQYYERRFVTESEASTIFVCLSKFPGAEFKCRALKNLSSLALAGIQSWCVEKRVGIIPDAAAVRSTFQSCVPIGYYVPAGTSHREGKRLEYETIGSVGLQFVIGLSRADRFLNNVCIPGPWNTFRSVFSKCQTCFPTARSQCVPRARRSPGSAVTTHAPLQSRTAEINCGRESRTIRWRFAQYTRLINLLLSLHCTRTHVCNRSACPLALRHGNGVTGSARRYIERSDFNNRTDDTPSLGAFVDPRLVVVFRH